ncbi:MAG: hypothetical protein ACKVQS_02005 [Fimbriimonadaceae bacterium]
MLSLMCALITVPSIELVDVSNPLVVRQEIGAPRKAIHSANLSTRRETRKVNGVDKEVSVSYRVEFFGSVDGDLDSPQQRHYRTTRARPEVSAPSFEMRSFLEALEIDDIEVAAAYFNLTSVGGEQTIGEEIQKAIRKTKAKYTVDTIDKTTINPNTNVQPGGWTTNKYAHQEAYVDCFYQVIGSYDDGTKAVDDIVASSSITVGRMWYPMRTFYETHFAPDGTPDKEYQELIGGITIEPIAVGVNLQVTLPEYNWVPTIKGSYAGGGYESDPPKLGFQNPQGYINDLTKENGKSLIDTMTGMGYSIPQMVDVLTKLAPEGTDMNRLNFPDPGDGCQYDFDSPPGTTWIPTDKRYQTMMTGARFNYQTMGFSLMAAIGRVPQQNASSMRVLCMNMEKLEPAKGVKYLPYRPSDPVFATLAKNMDDSRFRGPWDQARLWIYTDKATIERVNEKLVGGVSSAGYLMALADVNWAGGLDERMLKDANYIKPEFMLGAGAPDYATNFLMNTLDSLHPKKAGEWLKKNSNSLLQLAGPDAEETHRNHLVTVTSRLLNFDAPEDREATLKFLSAAAGKLGFMKGKIGTGSTSLYSGRNEEVSLVLALSQSGFFTPSKDALAFVAEKGPGDANKALAKSLMGN